MPITPKNNQGAKLGGGKLPAKAYSEYTRPGRTSENFSADVRSDAKLRRAPINLSILFGNDDDDEDNLKKIRKLAIQRKLKKQKRK